MSQSENILKELEEISTSVASIGTTNVYDIPADYFVNLPEQIINRIDLGEETSFLAEYKEKSIQLYEVPEDYFETLANNTISLINKLEDKGVREELSTLSPLLAEVPNSLPYTIPVNYFGELLDDVISGAQAIDYVNQKLEIESSLLHQMERKNVYTVPSGYFLKLPYTILQKVSGERPAIPFIRMYRKALGFAAAAVFAAVISISGWSYFHQAVSPNTDPELAGIEKVGVDEISNYLESAPVSPTETASIAIADNKNDEIKQLLADVSNEELEKYLDLHSVSKDLMTE